MGMKDRYREAYRLKQQTQKAEKAKHPPKRVPRKPTPSWTEWFGRHPEAH